MLLTIDKITDIFVDFCTEQAIDRRGYKLDIEIIDGEFYRIYIKHKNKIKPFRIILIKGTDMEQGLRLLQGLVEWQESLHRHPLEIMLMRRYGLY